MQILYQSINLFPLFLRKFKKGDIYIFIIKRIIGEQKREGSFHRLLKAH